MKQSSPDSHQLPAKSSAPDQKKSASSLLTRRNLLLLSGGIFAALGTWQWFKSSAKPEKKSAQDLPPVINAQQIDFLALSTILTSRQHLRLQTGALIYDALSKQNSEFQQRAAALFQFVKSHQLNDVDIIATTLKNKAELVPLETVLHQIIAAWYLGVVGKGTHSKVITYESALMFDQVRDVVGVPGYCPAAPGYWAAQPTVLKAG